MVADIAGVGARDQTEESCSCSPVHDLYCTPSGPNPLSCCEGLGLVGDLVTHGPLL